MTRRALWVLFGLSLLAFLSCNGCHDGSASSPRTAPSIAISSPGTSPAAPSQPAPVSTPEAARTAPPSAETIIHVEDDGQSFDVPRGGMITFKLASSAGTGYAWTPTRVDSDILVQQGGRSSEASSDAPGASRLDVYRFATGGVGSTDVEMSLARSFGNAPPGRVMRVTIHVH